MCLSASFSLLPSITVLCCAPEGLSLRETNLISLEATVVSLARVNASRHALRTKYAIQLQPDATRKDFVQELVLYLLCCTVLYCAVLYCTVLY